MGLLPHRVELVGVRNPSAESLDRWVGRGVDSKLVGGWQLCNSTQNAHHGVRSAVVTLRIPPDRRHEVTRNGVLSAYTRAAKHFLVACSSIRQYFYECLFSDASRKLY